MKPLKSTPIPDEVPARRYWPARRAILRILMPVLRLLYGFRVVGDPTMCSAPGPFVVVCNHVHTLDCVMVSKAFEQKRQWVLSLPSNLELPVAGAIVRVMGGIPVPDRPAGYRVLYRRLEEVFARGEFFQVYPEGELLPGCRTLRPFHPGAFLFAVRSGVPVVPCVLRWAPWEDGDFHLRRERLELCVLPAVSPEEFSGRSPRGRALAMCEAVQAQMRAALPREEPSLAPVPETL